MLRKRYCEDHPEEWKPISRLGPGGRYEISSYGRVRNMESGAYMKVGALLGGYPSVGVRGVDGKPKRLLIHRILAEEFIPNPHNLPEVNHIWGDKLDFDLYNLEWVTSSGNKRHALETGLKPVLYGLKHGNARITDEQVEQIRALKGTMSHQKIADMFGIARQTVSGILSGKKRKLKTCVWRATDVNI